MVTVFWNIAGCMISQYRLGRRFSTDFLRESFWIVINIRGLNAVLDQMAEKYGVSKTALAVAWISRHPAKMQTIVGTMKPKRLVEICDSEKITLSREDWYAIYRAAGNVLP